MLGEAGILLPDYIIQGDQATLVRAYFSVRRTNVADEMSIFIICTVVQALHKRCCH